MSTRPFPDRFYVFPIEVGTEPASYYLQVRSRYAMTVPIRLWAPAALAGHTLKTQTLESLFREPSSPCAVQPADLPVARRSPLPAARTVRRSFSTGIFSGNGYDGLLVWPEFPAFTAEARTFWMALAAALGLMFCREFPFGRAMHGRLITAMHLVEVVMLGCAGLLVLATWTPSLQQVVNMIQVVSAPAAGLLILTAAVRELRQGRRSSLLFLLAWGTLWLGAFVATERALGWLPSNVWSAHALQTASSVEMLLLALALADMIRIERENRDRAQLQALQAQAETVKLLSSSEERLERAIQGRAEQLQQAPGGHMRPAALVSHELRARSPR